MFDIEFREVSSMHLNFRNLDFLCQMFSNSLWTEISRSFLYEEANT